MNSFLYIPTPKEVMEKTPWWRQLLLFLGLIIPIGEGKRVEWERPLQMFLFLCQNCGELEIDYLHKSRGEQYLSCSCGCNCRIKDGLWGFYITHATRRNC